MSDATTMDAGPGQVKQWSWKPLGFLPDSVLFVLSFGLKSAIGLLSHNLYDVAVLGTDPAVFSFLSFDGNSGLSNYVAQNSDTFTPEATKALNEYLQNHPTCAESLWKMSDMHCFEQTYPDVLNDAMRKKLHDYTESHNGMRSLFGVKLFGEGTNVARGLYKKDCNNFSTYLSKKIVPGILYCALMSATYGGVVPALASFLVTAAMTDAAYLAVGTVLGLKCV